MPWFLSTKSSTRDFLVGGQWFRSLGAFGTPATRGPFCCPVGKFDGLTRMGWQPRGSDSQETGVLLAKKSISWDAEEVPKDCLDFVDSRSFFLMKKCLTIRFQTVAKSKMAENRATSQSLYWCFWMFECLAWMGENAPCRFKSWWSSPLVKIDQVRAGGQLGLNMKDCEVTNPTVPPRCLFIDVDM